jgi:predicted TIM-barrel fold metal-dependent hydrolase
MDEGGVAFQVLGLCWLIGTMLVKGPEEALKLAVVINNQSKKALDAQPTRFAALAEFPMHVPELAVKKLHRCVRDDLRWKA